MDERIPTGDELNAMTDTELKVLENRLRRAAKRQGLHLVKSRTRDPRAIDYGGYVLADAATETTVASDVGSPQTLSLAEVAEALFATAEKLEVKGQLIEQFRAWLVHDRFEVRGAIEFIENGDTDAALAVLHNLERDLLKQQSC